MGIRTYAYPVTVVEMEGGTPRVLSRAFLRVSVVLRGGKGKQLIKLGDTNVKNNNNTKIDTFNA